MGEGVATILAGGRVRNCEGDAIVEAVAFRDGRILAAGTRAEVTAAAGAGAKEVDVAGATVMPGLVDTHPHMLHFAARSGSYVDLADARDHADVVARIRRRAAETPKGDWIITTPVGEPFYFLRRSWRDLAERRLPDRHVLDRAAPDHPVFLSAYGPVMPNVCAFNSRGLKAVGLTRTVPGKVCDVEIEKDEDGDLTGILRGPVNNYYTFDPFWTQILLKLPVPQGDIRATTRGAMARYNALGVTTAYEGHNMTLPQIEVYRALRAEGSMTVRVSAALEVEPTAFAPFDPLPLPAFMANLEAAARLTERGDPWLRIDGATLAAGGPCWRGLLRMHEPYADPFGRPTRGMTFIGPEKQDAFIRFCADRGLRANFVAGGYRDHDDFLDACERLADAHPIRGRRWLIQHAILTTPLQAARYRALGFDITTSMSFCWGKGELYAARIGSHVLRDLVPLRRLLDAGLLVGCGSDWGPKNIFEHIRFAQTHEFAPTGRRNDDAEHAVTREQAIMMWTRDAARVLQWDDVGTLVPGKAADLVLLDRDPFDCDIDALAETRVLRTLVDGRPVYDAAA